MDSLGGSNDLPLYSKTGGQLVFENKNNNTEYDFVKQDTALIFNYTIQTERANGFYTVIEFERKETIRNSSFSGVIVYNATDSLGANKNHQAFRLNETPATSCCNWKKYSYSIASTGKFKKEDKLSLIILNLEKTSFFIKNFNVRIFDYSYNI